MSFWRVTTATRTFALALVAGISLSSGPFGEALPLFIALILIALLGAALELDGVAPAMVWVPIGEVSLAAILLTSAPSQPGLLVYLAVPPLVAGVRHGLVATLNTALVGCLVLIVTLAVGPAVADREQVSSSLLWLATGLGLGLLAGRRSRSARLLEERQAPHATTHQLMAQLHHLTRRGFVDLDSHRLAEVLAHKLRDTTGAQSWAIVVHGLHSMQVLSTRGDHERLLTAARQAPSAPTTPAVTVIPLRGGGNTLGQVVLERERPWTDRDLHLAQSISDEQALPLSTAFLFEGVRNMATAEERARIAREMHDGVAQEIVALGYVVDEIESSSSEANVQELAGALRAEISRVVTELRLSIFDLRQDVSDHLSGALAEYVRVTCDDTDIDAHLTLHESGPALSARTQVELLRVAQEAIGNVRRHAEATNLWVNLISDGTDVRLEIIDDGIGSARPREHHWGLQTMQERAAAVGAALTVTDREPSGTIVRLETIPASGIPASRREPHP